MLSTQKFKFLDSFHFLPNASNLSKNKLLNLKKVFPK